MLEPTVQWERLTFITWLHRQVWSCSPKETPGAWGTSNGQSVVREVMEDCFWESGTWAEIERKREKSGPVGANDTCKDFVAGTGNRLYWKKPSWPSGEEQRWAKEEFGKREASAHAVSSGLCAVAFAVSVQILGRGCLSLYPDPSTYSFVTWRVSASVCYL